MSASTLIAAKTTTGPGASVPVRKIRDKRTFQVSINGVATVAIEGSNDNANWVTLLSGVTSSSGYEDDAPWNYVRANVTSYTSGNGVTVVMGEKAE